ncbi:hypothetical protein EZM97_30305 [Dyella soli]|uniref:Uncharacterized protein n=1 Tax=Dyella soli TaxID=522319 RepID=A0A4V2NL26_9GAMM|nr:hypothetical protein [Dyella soli]TCI06918.1 hypothetical protein EZM97_30305 [Dyella soli]
MRRPWGWLLPLVLMVLPVMAQEVPPALKDWQEWVLHDVPQHACPVLVSQGRTGAAKECAWPGRLAIDAGKDGARFTFAVHVDVRSWIALPGDSHNWPQQVTAGSKPVVVLDRNGTPSLQLEPGDYELHGVLAWDNRPPRLVVPETIGLVTLTLDGNPVSRIERNGFQLTLGEAAAAQRVADALSLRVFRKLSDGVPALLESRLEFKVTGSAREQVLGPVLPKGFTATSLSGDLPAKLEGDGRLRVQLRPGTWTISLGARAGSVLSKVSTSLPAAPWPTQEIWSYADEPSLRSTRAEGEATDAAQADVPGEWRGLPAYVVDEAHGLVVEQGTRAGEGGQGDQITLHRELWLDADGRGLTAVDDLEGKLRHSQRLDVTAPWQLLRASQGEMPMLVTTAGKTVGVEVRRTSLDLSAGLRLPDHGSMPAGGWQLPLDGIDAMLHLPHGYRLVGATGADVSPDSWIARWSLLDLFVVALIALLAGRYLGWPWALAAVGFLALSLHEDGAPRWTLAVALALALLMRVLPDGRLRIVSRTAAGVLVLVAALWALPFAATQMSYALHPQLEEEASVYHAPPPPPSAMAVEEEASSNAAPAPQAPAVAKPADMLQDADGNEQRARRLETVTVTGSRIAPADVLSQELDAHAVLQAGRGIPRWDDGNNYRLGWSGPVTPDQTARLVIAPAWLVRLLRVVSLALLVALLGRLALNLLRPARSGASGWKLGGGVVALLALSLAPHGAHAQSTPDKDMLAVLRSRLVEAPRCTPDCASVAQAAFQVGGDALSLDLEVHAGTAVAVPLPLGDDALQLLSVSQDGRDAALLRRSDATLVKVDAGVHHLALRYRIAPVDTSTVHFPLIPRHVTFRGEGWAANGLDEGRLLGDSLALNRVLSSADGKTLSAIEQTFPPYVRIKRSLELGNEWNVTSEVKRMAPVTGGFSIELPLLPGEHPLGDDMRVQNGHVVVTFNNGQDTIEWRSRLDRTDHIALTAPALGDRAEHWLLVSAPIWHVETKGVPGNLEDEGLLFQPLPGETLDVAITKPKGVAGDTVAFDNVSVESHAGDRATETTLTLSMRAMRGGEHAITVPAGAELLDAQRDDTKLSLAIRDGKLSLPLMPVSARYVIKLRLPQGAGVITRTPAFALDAPTANITLSHVLPDNRWVLWTWGPTDGPAVLYWSQLVVLLLAAWLLARYAPTPLRFQHWLLLGLGFSAFAWGAYALVVAWLILLGLRARHVLSERYGTWFNVLQVALAGVTLVAIIVLITAVPKGLLGMPDMHVEGNHSAVPTLNWFADQADSALPQGGVFSVSLWVYKIAMLAWALWLANALIGWVRWGFDAWSHGGYWRKRKPKSVEPPPMPQPAE